jgi:hypothetical protein
MLLIITICQALSTSGIAVTNTDLRILHEPDPFITVKSPDFLNPPWCVATHGAGACLIRNFILHIQWLIEEFVTLVREKSVSLPV